MAVCISEVEVAIAGCSIALGTIAGSSAAIVGRSKACAAPSTATAAKIKGVDSQPPMTPIARNSTAADSISWQMSPMRRRSKRSATWPTRNVSTTIGRNCARPMKPRSKALWVRS